MTDHLPECGYRVDHPTLPKDRQMICICEELRACEQRVAGLSDEQIYGDGYAAGVQAAREAVQNLTAGEQVALYRDYALAAIDALTEGK